MAMVRWMKKFLLSDHDLAKMDPSSAKQRSMSESRTDDGLKTMFWADIRKRGIFLEGLVRDKVYPRWKGTV